MRYRVKDYTVQPVAGGVWLYFTAPQGVQLSSDPDSEIETFIQEAIRLVIDESEGIVLCSSMQKRVYLERAKCTPSTREVRLLFAVPEGKTVSSVSVFTIEMDWGDEPSGLTGGDAAEQVKDFFGIVKDGDTVKVVTEDGGEEVVEPVGLMDEDDVYDYLEDIAVLMGGITAQQAASITAATRAIIHGGSGSGEGGEGGSGSGSGE